MDNLEYRNRRIIDAVVEKAQAECPGALALVGISGSFASGRFHAGSDLDLLILINDERGRRLAETFIQDDLQVGHDLYCQTWDDLRRMAAYEHPWIAKLLDSGIGWCADEAYRRELKALRAQARERLAAPFGEADWEKAEGMLKEAGYCAAMAGLAQSLSETRLWAGGAVYYIENAVAMLNKAWFRYGVRYCFEELAAMEKRPEDLCGLIGAVAAARDTDAVRESLTALLRAVAATFREVRQALDAAKPLPSADALRGTGEEMVSNWRNKMQLAAQTGDRHLAFMSLASLDNMLSEIRRQARIGEYDAMGLYDPDDLAGTARRFDALLTRYFGEYARAGLQPARYADIDAFAAAYLQKDSEG